MIYIINCKYMPEHTQMRALINKHIITHTHRVIYIQAHATNAHIYTHADTDMNKPSIPHKLIKTYLYFLCNNMVKTQLQKILYIMTTKCIIYHDY